MKESDDGFNELPQGTVRPASRNNRYLALSARRHRWTTVPQLAHDATVSGRRICQSNRENSHLAETGLYARNLVWCFPLAVSRKKDRILGS
ncbi:hypothetical protein TNCV_5024381 [Trichonephila clavipes]|nr:hypothetical protein TNCV_5024381 [Trichonephila clavipes]